MSWFTRRPPIIATESAPRAEPAFSWLSFSRYVEVYRVRIGWLVIWGVYQQTGAIRTVAGQRVYATPQDARARVSAAILALTGSHDLARECLIRFDRTPFPDSAPAALPPTL